MSPTHTSTCTEPLSYLSSGIYASLPSWDRGDSGPASGCRQLGKPQHNKVFCPCRDIFSQGFGPFRWVCTSGDPQDLAVTDQLATSVLEEAIAGGGEAVGLEMLEGKWPPKSPIASLPGSAGQPSTHTHPLPGPCGQRSTWFWVCACSQ